MAQPTNRDEFREYCLRKLGKPVHRVNVDEDQVQDRIDEALSYYTDYHMDAVNRTYFKYQVQQGDADNRYITMPENIIGAVQVFPISSISSYGTDMFNIKYQVMLNDVWNMTSISMVPYFMTMQELSLLEEMLVGAQPIRFSRHQNRLYIDADWSRIVVGHYIIVEAFEVISPDDFPSIWSDRWLQNYATAKIKQQWGENIGMYDAVLPGGIKLNSDRIIREATYEVERLEKQMLSSYSLPPLDFLA